MHCVARVRVEHAQSCAVVIGERCIWRLHSRPGPGELSWRRRKGKHHRPPYRGVAEPEGMSKFMCQDRFEVVRVWVRRESRGGCEYCGRIGGPHQHVGVQNLADEY